VRAVALCVDETSQTQALDRTAPILPVLPCTPERTTRDYKRWRTSSLYEALDISTEQVGLCTPAHRAVELRRIDWSILQPDQSTTTEAGLSASTGWLIQVVLEIRRQLEIEVSFRGGFAARGG
jgi:hypothetical protein